MNAALLTLSQLRYRAGGRYLLDDITALANAGELIALLGPNGAGKSSLIKVLAREFSDYGGDVLLQGTSLKQWRGPALAGMRAVMPQHTTVAFPFAAAEVVALGLPGRHSGNASHPVVTQLMRWLQVEHLAWRFYSSLSGGEQQRVQLARVLTQLWFTKGPKLLLLDECTSALDPAQQYRVMAVLARLAQRGDFCVVVACHDLALAASFATRVWMLDHGRLVADGTPAQVLQRERLESVYGIATEVQLHSARPVIHIKGCSESIPELV